MGDFMYQAEKFGDARRALMAPHPKGEEDSFARAFHECWVGLKDLDESRLDGGTRHAVDVIRRALDTAGVASISPAGVLWPSKIKSMDERERYEFSNAVDTLATWFDQKFPEAS